MHYKETLKVVDPSIILHDHDVQIQELKSRINSLEKLVNDIHQAVPVYWNDKT